MAGGVPDDSGQKALIGFLFQLVDTATHAYPITGARGDDAVNGVRFRTVVTTETLEDATKQYAQNGKIQTDVIQYKFSSDPGNPSNRIGLPEMYSICMKLFQGIQFLEAKFRRNATPVLITNRELRTDVQAMLDDAKNGRGEQNDDIWNTLEKKRKNNPPLYRGRNKTRNKEYLRTLKKLKFQQRDFSQSDDQLAKLAAEYGILGDELRAAQSVVTVELAKLATSTAKNFRSFGRSDLVKWMTGEDTCWSLDSDKPAERIREIERGFSQRQNVPEDVLLRANVVKECFAAAEPIVHIYGQGGTGKSVVLATLMREIRSTPPFCGVTSAISLGAGWPSSVVSDLRNVTGARFHDETLFRASSRLAGATAKTKRNQLLLLVDACDERMSSSSKSELKRLVDFVIEENNRGNPRSKIPIRLIVTGRDRKEFSRWFLSDGGYSQPSSDVKSVALSSFDSADISQLPPGFFDPKLDSILRDASQNFAALNHQTSNDRNLPVRTSTVPKAIFDALLHPALLGSLRQLSKKSLNLAESALRGKEDGLLELSKTHLDWFSTKVEKRTEIKPDHTLRCVAEIWSLRGRADVNYKRDDDWCDLALRSRRMSDLTGELFEEAVSAGLILEQSGAVPSWKWRNTILTLGLSFICEQEGITR